MAKISSIVTSSLRLVSYNKDSSFIATFWHTALKTCSTYEAKWFFIYCFILHLVILPMNSFQKVKVWWLFQNSLEEVNTKMMSKRSKPICSAIKKLNLSSNCVTNCRYTSCWLDSQLSEINMSLIFMVNWRTNFIV